MNKIFYAPLLKIKKEREAFVEDNYKTVEASQKEIDEKTNYKETELEKSREQARNLIKTETKKLRDERDDKLAEYKIDLYLQIDLEQENLRQSAIEAKEVLKDKVVDIAKDVSLLLLGDDIEEENINKSMIED
jgi:F0F1-type ATP synthase membrane subunit b/b'